MARPSLPPDLAPESALILARMGELGLLDRPTATTAELRALSVAEAEALVGPPVAVGGVEEIPIAAADPARQVPLRVYRPPGEPRRAILWIHGGGWVVGSLDAYDSGCRALCLDADALVVSVGYRLAPEHPFPAGLEDCFAALGWLDRRLGDADRRLPLIVAGDSAGGNLTAALCLLARERGGPAIDRQVPIYPVTEPDFETASYRDFAEGYGLSREVMRWFWEQYVGAVEGEVDERAAVLRADLAGLPPATVVIASCDVLRDDGEAYVARLADAGVPVSAIRHAGQMHGFWFYSALSGISRRVNAEIVATLPGADDS